MLDSLIAILRPLTAAQVALVLGLWTLVTALTNAIAHRSQIDAWCERRPKLAGAMKLARGLVVHGITLWLRGKLPEPLRKAIPVLLAALVVGCSWLSGGQESCAPDSELIALEAEYMAAVTKACPAESYDAPEECPAFAAIDAAYDAKRDAWVSCGGAQ